MRHVVSGFRDNDMDLNARRAERHVLIRTSGGSLVVTQRSLLQYPTTVIERSLLMITVVLLPLEDHIPAVAGFSVLFVMFGVLAAYVFVNRLRALARIWLHPVFLTAYLILFLCTLIETFHANPRYSELLRFGLMVTGASFIASLCRDQVALRTTIYSYVIASIWLSALLFFSSYGFLQGASADNYNQASYIRTEAAKEISISANLNNMAIYTAQGANVAFTLALTSRSFVWRNLLSAASLFCLIATFLPMSRSGLVVFVASSLIVLLLSRTKPLRILILTIILGFGALMWVPKVVFSRMDIPQEGARTKVYAAAFEHFDEYILAGIGAGDFWNSWGYNNGFRNPTGDGTIGAHNGFVQIALYWGLSGLVGLCVLIWQAYRCLPRQSGENDLALCLVGLAISLLLVLFFFNSFYEKWDSLGLGLLVGTHCWVWPHGTTRPRIIRHRALSSGFVPPFSRAMASERE
jgi:hypothetical protein